MNKLLFTFLLLFICAGTVNAVSLFNAQDITKSYLQENEMIDAFSQGPITCDSNSYYVIPIISGTNDISFFVIMYEKDGKIYSGKDQSTAMAILKSEYILRSLYYSSSYNYLSTQLFDRMDQLNNLLNSKKSRLEGLIASNYPIEVKTEITNTKNKIVTLSTSIDSLKSNLKHLYDIQSNFVYTPNCSKLNELTNNFSTAFIGYSDISKQSLDYLDAIDNTTKIIVANKQLSDDEKRSILNFISAPTTLNSEVSFIYDSLSSTNIFYSNLILATNTTNENKGLMIYYNNFISRMDFVTAKSMLYDFDSDFPRYDNLDSVINVVLDPTNRINWNAQEDVDALYSEYTQIKELYSKGRYKEVIPKIKSIKTKTKNILVEGFIEYDTTTSSLYYWLASGIILVILVVIISRNIRRKNQLKNKQKKSEDFSRNFDDDSLF